MTEEQRSAARRVRTSRRETVSALAGAVVVLVNNVMGMEPNAELTAAMVTILTISGHRWTDRN